MMVVLMGCVDRTHARGGVLTIACAFYILSALGGGYVSSYLYHNLGGDRWILNILMTATFYVGPLFLGWSTLNTLAIFYGSTAAMPFPVIMLLFAIWACITFPLTVLGGIVGRQVARYRSRYNLSNYSTCFPCKTNKLPREIPEHTVTWYHEPVVQFLVSGFLPFSAIYIELHYVFDSVWGDRIYTVYGILLFAILLVILISCLTTMLFTYLTLNSENYHWWWSSFCNGFAIGPYFFAYALYYYAHSYMESFLQTAFYLMYSALISYGLGLAFGSVSFFATFLFVEYIYGRIKAE